MKRELTEGARGMRPGQDLVAAGYIGLKGTSLAAVGREEELLSHFAKPFIRQCQGVYEQFAVNAYPACFYKETEQGQIGSFWKTIGATEWKAAGEGGVMAALWELFSEYGLGFEIGLRALPVLQETIEVCEVFDMNPYRLQSEGCYLLSGENGGDLVRKLEKTGIHGVVIGKVEAGIKRQIYNGEIRSFLDRPKPDELYKVLTVLS